MDIVAHVKRCIADAEALKSKVTPDILAYEGMSGSKTRHFYNKICSLPNAKYLEIGTWYGSSSISALYGNKIEATFIDNWSQFNGNKDILVNALEKYKGESTYQLIESDSWKVNVDQLPVFDIYLYDGGHTYHDQYTAISYYLSKLSKHCIVIIDDWNWEQVRKGTYDALLDCGVKVLYRTEVFVDESEQMPSDVRKNGWWNGIGIFVLDK